MMPLRRAVATRLLFALAALGLLPAPAAHAQEYKYYNVPRVLYVLGRPEYDRLPPPGQTERWLSVYSSLEAARQYQSRNAPETIYRVYRQDLEATPEGVAFLEKVQSGRRQERWDMTLTSAASLQETVLRRARTGHDLGPVNPNWKATGPYATTPLQTEYLPGEAHQDADRGTFYFPAEGPPEAVDLVRSFQLHFEPDAQGQVIAKVRSPTTGQLVPLDTRNLKADEPGACLFVMDAAGNFYVLAAEWIDLRVRDYIGVNHSSIPAGHPVAAAGMLVAENGRIVSISNASGHYKPTNSLHIQAINALERNGVAKGSYAVDFGADDYPGETYIALDPRGKEKLAASRIQAPPERSEAAPATPAPPEHPPNPDDSQIIEPLDPEPTVQRDVDRRGALPEAQPTAVAPEKPAAPPDPAVIERVRAKIAERAPEQMDIAFMREIYALDPQAAKVVGQIMADPALSARNLRMGELRKQMDLQVWKEILKAHHLGVEITNQGKTNGIRSDLDYTLYYIAEEAGIPIQDLIAEHGETWKRLHGLTPEQVEIKVMNGDEFYPDWRTESLSEFEHQARVKEMLGRLRQDREKYSVPGANKEQTHNRALRDGYTEMLAYNPELDKPEIPVEKQVIRDAGLTREIAQRYRGVHPQYNHMNALGNLVQNMGEYLHLTGLGTQDAIRRAKYGNRIVNEGLGGLRFFANDYQSIFASDPNRVWARTSDGQPITRDDLLRDYIRKTFGLLMDDNGRPLFNDADIEHFKRVIDISMQIELDKTRNRANYADESVRAEYFQDYRNKAEANVAEAYLGLELDPEQRRRFVVDEQERLFEAEHRRVLAEAVLAGLRQSVARDLTPEGVLRNRIRFDPATGAFVMEDLAGARKVAFERAVEVALFYELVNGIQDPFVRHDLKKRVMTTAPSSEVAQFYGALDQVDGAEIDRFIRNDPQSKVQRTIDDLILKREQRALELAIERKQRAVEAARARGVTADPNSITPEQVREEIVDGQLARLRPGERTQLLESVQTLGSRLTGDFKEAFYQNASALMLGSSAVNLVRAYQAGCGGAAADCATAMTWAAFSEAIWYMPSYVSTPFLVLDLAAKAHDGRYGEAAWGAGLFGAMAVYPSVGHAMLVYNIVNGSFEIAHTYFVTRIDQDLTEQALKSRPRAEDGGPLAPGMLGPARARPNRFPDRKESVYNGSPPAFPLFYGPYRNPHAVAPTAVADGVKYSDGTVPHDNLSDRQLADTAALEFAAQIDSILRASGVKPGGEEWARQAWQLKLKFGFDIPFYRRVEKVYREKYDHLLYDDTETLQPHYLQQCRLDVYDWYVRQPQGYKDELAGEARGLGAIFRFLSDQTDRMQEMIAQQCAQVMAAQHRAVERAAEVNQANMAAFKTMMDRAFAAERGLLAARQALHQKIQTEEERAAAAVEKKALERAEKHQTLLAVNYPFTFATEELPPVLDFDVRTLPAKVKGPVGLTVEEELAGMRAGAPGGWRPGKAYEPRFQPDADGWAELRPITADVRFTARLLDRDSAEVAQAKLELPVVLYERNVSGSATVMVYGMGEKGDSTLYNGAEVKLGNVTRTTGPIWGTASFGKLPAGTHTFKVTPRPDDKRHGPGAGSGTIADVLLSSDPRATDQADVVVKLPYIPGTKQPEQPKPPAAANVPAVPRPARDSAGAQPPADTARGGGRDTATARTPGEVIRGLTSLTSEAEKTRDDARAACRYIEAARAQREVVAAANTFLAKSFPGGAPASVQQVADGFRAELAALEKAATAQEQANVYLREARASLQTKRAEPTLAALEKAAAVPDIPPCLYDQVMALYNQIKSDLEKRMKLIDQATDAANVRCDYATALDYAEQVEKAEPSLSWVERELPRIRDLNERQQKARALATQAEAKAQEGEQLGAQGKMQEATAAFDAALEAARQALEIAPECEKNNLKSLLDLPARKAALTGAKIDLSLVLLLDTSGSMGDNNKIVDAKQAATDAVKSLGPGTEVAVLAYDGGCGGGWRVVQGFSTDRSILISAIASLSPGGGTPTAPAVAFAQQYLQQNHRGASGQIMLMTDGQNDCGSMAEAGDAVRRSTVPVRLDAVAFGLGEGGKAQDDLGALVRAAGGNGSTYSANSAKELISAFRRAFIANQIKPRDPFVTGEAGTRLAQLFAAAVESLKQNNLREATDQLRFAADQFPASPAAAYNASLAYEASGQPLQAMNYAKQYLSLAPNAFDAGQVRARIDVLEREQAANPRAIYAPGQCTSLYTWAQRESRAKGMDAARRVKVFDILTTAQRGDCAAAQAAYDRYAQQYGRQ